MLHIHGEDDALIIDHHEHALRVEHLLSGQADQLPRCESARSVVNMSLTAFVRWPGDQRIVMTGPWVFVDVVSQRKQRKPGATHRGCTCTECLISIVVVAKIIN